MKKILFVCTGNSCRSPMAAAITAARMTEALRKEISVSSAGTGAYPGMGAAPNAIAVLKEIGIDLNGHRTKLLTKKMVDEADLVVAMTESHKEEILRLAPDSHGKVIVLGELDSTRESPDIFDPMGGGEDVYRRTRDEMDRLVHRLIDYLIDVFRVRS
jgi:protein-tyrosine-phosphatase